MGTGVSKRELGRLLGVSDTAVRKAEKAGRIQALPDGTFDPDAARAAWVASSEPSRTKVRTGSQQSSTTNPRLAALPAADRCAAIAAMAAAPSLTR